MYIILTEKYTFFFSSQKKKKWNKSKNIFKNNWKGILFSNFIYNQNFFKGRLKVFEGVPAPYDTKKRKVVNEALKNLRMKNHRKFCLLGDLCTQVGWKHQTLVDRLEERRKKRAQSFHDNKVKKRNQKRSAEGLKDVKDIKQKLAVYGF